MTDSLQALYDYTLEHRFPVFLMDDNYRYAGDIFSKHLHTLEQALPPAQKDILKKLCDALDEQRDIELEAMFQAAWAVMREL
ncbi:MAG: hypothetical protein Q4C45_11870 [Oscillospiraceae bacterium]|nr:hypothetical protein [Oscillospiraceae bacterium]